MPQDPNHQENILNILQDFHGLDSLRELFWTELNYDRQNDGLSRGDWGDTARNALIEDPVLFATGGIDNAFHVIYARLNADQLLLTAERPVISRLLRDHPYTLFVFSNREQTDWHFVNVKYDTEEFKKRRLFRRITISPYEKLRTASERIAMLDLEFINPNLEELSPFAIQTGHEKAFDVEAVTEEFFEDYQSVFHDLQDDLTGQTADKRWAHDYALQFLNRCMFLYFIQRKRWLGDDTEFLQSFWENYQAANEPVDSFVHRWLSVLFFEAFNNKFHGGHRHFPDQIREALALAPYLNGGLFTENALDREYDFQISDSRFEEIFAFLEKYNFTIAEDSPLDQEVAVDPEMIGKVYESLVNVSDEEDEQGDAGIFYTQRTEIDLMCRLALVDNLTNHLGKDHKNLLYEVIFAFSPDDKVEADGKLTEMQLWEPLDATLKELTVVDPACGSGSFLVGLLYILDDLHDRVNQGLGREESSFDRKKGIIGQNLYGVDVKEWACHVAELRLWLALVIDTEFSREELHARSEPLLPHFSFNIRCGDSLVQEIGGMNLATLRDAFSGVPPALKARITRLKNEKLRFFDNDPICRYGSEEELLLEELELFRTLVDTHAKDINQQIDDLQQLIDAPRERQMRLDGTVEEGVDRQLELQAMEWQQQIEVLTEDLDHLKVARSALVSAKDVPFVWDIAFVEIFTGEKEGFDIVIGNPPYVRQGSIVDPNLPREEAITPENKKAYKAKLARSVYQAFSNFFSYKRQKDIIPDNPAAAVSHKLDANNDLYIYFYFHGLSLLNPQGSFCFVTSNSWLDVAYGKDLQEFLLKYCRIKQIIDNEVRRSFASADINTVICLFSAPDETSESGLDQTARFVMFKIPFEGALDAVIFYEIETASERIDIQEHRVFPITHEDLLKSGSDDTSPNPQYTGDKWGKYLRGPAIYWTILEKGEDKLVRLGDVAEVKRGFTTGANKFFYLNDQRIQEWGIEDEFLKPVIKSPQECNSIPIDPSQLKFKLFMCGADRTDLAGTAALEYIKWGESEGFDQRPSCRGRARWYDLGEWEYPDMLWSDAYSDRFGCFENIGDYFGDKRFFLIKFKEENLVTRAYLNSTIIPVLIETEGITNLGEGVIYTNVYWLKTLPILEESCVENEIRQCYETMKTREILPIFDEIQQPDRRALDALIFDALDLTQEEQEEMYEAVAHLVETRLRKAQSLRGS